MNVAAVKTPAKGSGMISGERESEIERITQHVFDQTPTRIAFPGGKSRSVFICDISGTLYVFAKRANKYDAKVEAKVLASLGPTGLTPQFINRHGRWVVQECIDGQRVPLLIEDTADEMVRVAHVSHALDGLLQIQDHALRTRLKKHVPQLGVVPNWIADRIGNVDKVSKLTGLASPALNRTRIAQIYDVPRDDFVKWDSRLGNALLDGDRMVWFDWEDCGRRHRLDDIVCLLADEWTQIEGNSLTRLVDAYLPEFARNMPADQARLYFHVAGCLQIIFRLNLAMGYYHRDGKWWNREACLSGDKVGVTPSEVTRLCRRLKLWSQEDQVLAPFSPWADQLAHTLELDL